MSLAETICFIFQQLLRVGINMYRKYYNIKIKENNTL